MILRCDACGSRYHLDRTLIQGYRGARIRCRRCGHPIVVSIPPDPPRPRLPAQPASPVPSREGGFLRNRTAGTVALAEPAAEETPAPEMPPDNIVDLLRYRGASRPRVLPCNQDISDRISPEIPAAASPIRGNEPEIPGTEDPPPPDPAVSARAVQRLTFEEGFLWREPPPREKSAFFSGVKITLLFSLAGTAAAYLVFHLFLSLVAWVFG